jgi:hypothetical protein
MRTLAQPLLADSLPFVSALEQSTSRQTRARIRRTTKNHKFNTSVQPMQLDMHAAAHISATGLVWKGAERRCCGRTFDLTV